MLTAIAGISRITEVRADGEPATEGYGMHVRACHTRKMPVDGLVLFMDPYSAPDKSGLKIADVPDNNGRGIYLQEVARRGAAPPLPTASISMYDGKQVCACRALRRGL